MDYIARIHSDFPTKFGIPRQPVQAQALQQQGPQQKRPLVRAQRSQLAQLGKRYPSKLPPV